MSSRTPRVILRILGILGSRNVGQVVDRTALIRHLKSEGIKDESVLRTIQRVRRELFVPSQSEHLAYSDRPLPIGEGQTISQPYIVALMTEALHLRPNMKVLEIGTGSGYQTAILSCLAGYIISLERRRALAERATLRLAALGYLNVEVHHADGALGWSEGAPYDAIVVTAGSPRIPEKLVEQLAEGGKMVIPVGSLRFQSLRLLEKHSGQIQIFDLGAVRFVPLVGEGAWQDGVEDTEDWST